LFRHFLCFQARGERLGTEALQAWDPQDEGRWQRQAQQAQAAKLLHLEDMERLTVEGAKMHTKVQEVVRAHEAVKEQLRCDIR
jgi:hypothetical protein